MDGLKIVKPLLIFFLGALSFYLLYSPGFAERNKAVQCDGGELLEEYPIPKVFEAWARKNLK